MKALTLLRQHQNSIAYCVKENKPCIVSWVNLYFKDCLCNVRDEFSFVFGLISLICWAVAEIPQIITNFRTKSSHGVSLLFLLGWVLGDIFNLTGCLLEPATLPTQLYTAVLYTATTIILVLQVLYYDYLYRCWKRSDNDSDQLEVEESLKKPLIPEKTTDSGIPIPSRSASRRMDYYYTSARSLAGSSTPPFRSNLRPIVSGPSAVGLNHDDSSDDDAVDAPLNISGSQPKPIPRSAGYGSFLATLSGMPHQTKALIVGFGGRKLLQEHGMEHSALGQCLGWMMAAVYMGGRLPQIWLNIKRGSVEGLNPFMFVFALVANVTYVGSILLRSIEWSKIKANMPWLLDAVACVALDLFIILQYVYYKYFRKNSSTSNDREDEGAYKEANKN